MFLVKNEFKHLFNSDIKSLENIYIDFLSNLDIDAIKHLYNTFIVETVYNGFKFENNILKTFIIKNYKYNDS